MVKKKKGGKNRKDSKKEEGLTIYFMPYSEIAHKDSIERIKKILGVILQNKIIILQGRLKPTEEAKLIENTMTLIGNIPGFKGIEIAEISGEDEDKTLFEKIRYNVAKILVGEQDAITIIGPANIVKDIKKDPKKIELMLNRK